MVVLSSIIVLISTALIVLACKNIGPIAGDEYSLINCKLSPSANSDDLNSDKKTNKEKVKEDLAYNEYDSTDSIFNEDSFDGDLGSMSDAEEILEMLYKGG